MASNSKSRVVKSEEPNNVQTPEKENTVKTVVDVPEKEEEQPEVIVEEPVADQTNDQNDEDVLSKEEIDFNEQIALAKELNLTIRKDPHSGKPMLPSTPAMRAAAALAARKTTVAHTGINIDGYVIEHFGEQAASNPNVKLIVSTLSDYVKRMSPNASIDEKTGGELQAKLANMYDIVLSLKPELAQVCLEIIVAVVKQHLRGAFQQTSALRFANTMPLNTERSLRFQLLTTLFMSMASGTTKANLAKTINIRQLLEYITERNAKANISEFIN